MVRPAQGDEKVGAFGNQGCRRADIMPSLKARKNQEIFGQNLASSCIDLRSGSRVLMCQSINGRLSAFSRICSFDSPRLHHQASVLASGRAFCCPEPFVGYARTSAGQPVSQKPSGSATCGGFYASLELKVVGCKVTIYSTFTLIYAAIVCTCLTPLSEHRRTS